MKIIKQIFIILLFYVIGEALSKLVTLVFNNIYIPGTIIGMILLLVALITNKLKLEYVDEVGTFLTSNMGFFFIPAAVSVIEYLGILSESIVKILVIITLSTLFSFIAITWSVKLTVKLQNKKEDNNA